MSLRKFIAIVPLIVVALIFPLAGDGQMHSMAPSGPWQKAAFTAQTTTVQTVKASAGSFGGYYVSNVANTASSCLQVFDTSGAVTLGSTTPSMVYEIPASGAANIEISQGVSMTKGIKLAVATTCTGSTAPSSGLNLNIYFR